jgi:hypothetical protein
MTRVAKDDKDDCELAVCGLCGAIFDCETEYQLEDFSEV